MPDDQDLIISELEKWETYLRRIVVDNNRPMNTEKMRVMIDYTRANMAIRALRLNRKFMVEMKANSDGQEVVSYTTLSRGIFEIHLIIKEYLSTKEGFLKTIDRSFSLYRDHLNLLVTAATKANDLEDAEANRMESYSLEEVKQKWELQFGSIFGEMKKPEFNYRELAKAHGCLDEYEFGYRILSVYLHPSMIYLTETAPEETNRGKDVDDTIHEYQISKKTWIRKLALKIALDFSARTCVTIRDWIDNSTLVKPSNVFST